MIVVGAGGHAKEVVDELLRSGHSMHELTFFDNVNEISSFLGRPVHGLIQETMPPQDFIIAVGGPSARRKLFRLFLSAGHRPFSVQARSALISPLGATLGAGLNIMAGVIIGPHTLVADGVLLNSGTHVHHDSSIGAFSELSPRVSVLGGVRIGEEVKVGTGAILLPGVEIGDGAVIGAATMVNRNIPAGVTVMGIPARQKRMGP